MRTLRDQLTRAAAALFAAALLGTALLGTGCAESQARQARIAQAEREREAREAERELISQRPTLDETLRAETLRTEALAAQLARSNAAAPSPSPAPGGEAEALDFSDFNPDDPANRSGELEFRSERQRSAYREWVNTDFITPAVEGAFYAYVLTIDGDDPERETAAWNAYIDAHNEAVAARAEEERIAREEADREAVIHLQAEQTLAAQRQAEAEERNAEIQAERLEVERERLREERRRRIIESHYYW